MWADQPTVHHSVWEDHFHSHHTPQHAFLLTIRPHWPGGGAGVLCKGSCSYTEWKWYLQQLGVSDYLQRCESNTTTLYICTYVILNSKHTNVIVFVHSDLFPASPAAVGAPIMFSLAPMPTRGAVRVTWSSPTNLCGLTNPQYTIEYGLSTATPTTHPSTPSSSPFDITGLEVGQEYFVRVAVRTQSGSGTFSSWESVTTYEGKRAMSLHVILSWTILTVTL